MESDVIGRYKSAANLEAIRRMLIKYFKGKGFTDFGRILYPADMVDLGDKIPVLANKVEVVPYAADLDTILGRATIGWNLFVLGNQRMYLGDTYHNNLSELARLIRGGWVAGPDQRNARRQTTPKKVISFVVRVLGGSESGLVDLNPPAHDMRKPLEPFMARGTMMGGMPQQLYQRPAI